MNFLAHLWLAEHSGTSLAGSILGDVVRGRDLSAYPDDVALGIRLHRRIDAMTDRHPLIVAARERFATGQRRYAGIVLDLACDYLLARDWDLHNAEPMTAFSRRAAESLAAAGPWFVLAGAPPPRAEPFHALLMSYAQTSGIEHALDRIKMRLRDPQAFALAAQQWHRHAQGLQAQLPQLLSELRDTMNTA